MRVHEPSRFLSTAVVPVFLHMERNERTEQRENLPSHVPDPNRSLFGGCAGVDAVELSGE